MKKVLLVDDSDTTLLMHQMILKSRTQYDLFTASDGAEAVDVARQCEPDLVLMDVVMPRMDGLDACRAMRELDCTRSVPIILLTTRSEEEYVSNGFECGCSAYVTKPMAAGEMVAMLRGYLGE